MTEEITNQKALIIIDMQHDICDGGPMANNNSLNIIPKINSFRDDYNLIIFVRKSHSINHASFKRNGGKYPKHCIVGTYGHELNQDLIIKNSDTIISRCTKQDYTSNSAFYDDEDTQKQTNLKYLLKINQIKNIYFCGNNMDSCIFSTILDALNYNFNCYVIKDAVGYIDKEKYEECIKFLMNMNVHFV